MEVSEVSSRASQLRDNLSAIRIQYSSESELQGREFIQERRTAIQLHHEATVRINNAQEAHEQMNEHLESLDNSYQNGLIIRLSNFLGSHKMLLLFGMGAVISITVVNLWWAEVQQTKLQNVYLALPHG
jgi:hypothetical protein